MKLLSAKSRIAIGLVCLLVSVLCTAMMMGIVPERRSAVLDGRASMCETIAMSSSDYISRGELRRLEYLLKAVVTRNDEILSAGVRRANGELVATVGDHIQLWDTQASTQSTESQVHVPIRSGAEKWGSVELRFRPLSSPGWRGWLEDPWVRLTTFVTGASYLLFLLYLRKMLAHLDPSQTVPRRVRSALDSLAEGLLVIDKDQRIVLANQSFASWVGQAPEKLIGVSAAKLNWVRNEQGDPLEQYPWVEAIRLETPQAGVMVGLTLNDDPLRVLMANASPVLGHDGKYRGVLVSFDDVTQLEETKRDLSVAKRAAEEANQAKSEFLARMSHEIRTPMNAILGYTDVLRRGFDESSENRQEYLDTIHGSGEHLLALINDILDLSKVESGQMELEMQRCSPHKLISQVVTLLRSKADEKGIGLECKFEGLLPETILADSVRLRQTIMNLAGNAIKFTEQGGVTLVARLIPRTADATGGSDGAAGEQQMAIDVVDTGIGIPKAAQDKIFEPFAQADTSVTRKFGGTGLGLAISKQLAEAMGGGITITSEEGKGSTFSVAVDIGPLDNVPLVDGQEALAGASETAAASQEIIQLPPARILVADDGESNRKLIQLVLGRAGVEVVPVENGLLAHDRALETPFDIILMDMQMPVMDGYTATTKLREAGYERPILALTAHAMRGDEEKCRAAGCSGFLTKPIKIDVLLSTLNQLLTEHPPISGVQRSNENTAAASPPPPRPSTCGELGADVEQQLDEIVETARSASGRQVDAAAIPATIEVTDSPPIHCSFPLDDPDFRAIAEGYTARLTEQLAAMKAAATLGDLHKLAELAHWLKGSGGTAGFEAFTEPARELELAAKAGQSDLCQQLVARLAGMADRIDLTDGAPPAAGQDSLSLAGPAQSVEPIRSSFPLDDPEFREIAEGYTVRLHEQLGHMREAIARRDDAELAQLSHWLKGSGGTAGFDCFTEPARQLELAAKAGERDRYQVLVGTLIDMAGRIDLGDSPVEQDAASLNGGRHSTRQPDQPVLVSSLPVEDPDFREIVEEFVARLAQKLAAMKAAWQAQDYSGLAELAHWLKGSGGTAGFDALTATAKSLEDAARAQDEQRIGSALDELWQLSERIELPASDPGSAAR